MVERRKLLPLRNLSHELNLATLLLQGGRFLFDCRTLYEAKKRADQMAVGACFGCIREVEDRS